MVSIYSLPNLLFCKLSKTGNYMAQHQDSLPAHP